MRDCDWPRNGSAGRRNGHSAYYNRISYHKKAALPMSDFMPRDGCNFGTELLYWGKRIKILQMRSLDDILSAKRGAAPMMRDYYKKMPGDRKDGWKIGRASCRERV